MTISYILDTSVLAQADADTYGSPSELIARIISDHGLALTGAGIIEVALRCSDGAPYLDLFEVDGTLATGSDGIRFIPQMSNGNPFIHSETSANTSSLVKIRDNNISIVAAEEGSWILRADPANEVETHAHIYLYSPAHIEGYFIDGGNSSVMAGVYCVAAGSTSKNGTIMGCNREFVGAIRDTSNTMTFDLTTVKNSRMIRSCGAITNSIVTGTNLNDGISDGIADGSNNNAYDVAKSSIKYAGSGADTNSVFSFVVADELTNSALGGYDIKSGSALATLSTTSGPVGAYADVASGEPPTVAIYLSGDTLNATVTDDVSSVFTLQLNIENTPKGATQTTPAWDLTSYNLDDGYHRLTVTATDGDGNSSTSEDVFYSVGGVIGVLEIGNSISNTAIEPTNTVGGNVMQMVKAMFQAAGSDIRIVTKYLGGSGYAEFRSDASIMNELGSGDHALVLFQTYLEPSVEYHTTNLKPMVDLANSTGMDTTVWYSQLRENIQNTLADTIAIHDAGVAVTSADSLEVIKAWHAVRAADPSIDIYADNTHQNEGGLYISALSIYVYLSGKAANSVTYEPSTLQGALGADGLGYSAAQVQTIKDSVDAQNFPTYVRSISNNCAVTITQPGASVAITEGDSITFTAVAIDSSTGDLSSSIVWKDESTVLHTGATFVTTSLAVGGRTITANCLGSDSKTSTAARSVQVNSLINLAPVAINSSREVDHNVAFTQIPLQATDDNDQIDWSTLIITQQPVNARVPAVQNGSTLTTVDVDYSTTDFAGQNTLKWTVADTSGNRSNEATVNLSVQQAVPASIAIANSQVSRGQSFDVIMSNYIAGPSLQWVEVWLKDLTGEQAEYPCVVTVNEDSLVRAYSSDSSMPDLALAQAIVRPVATINGLPPQ